MYLCVVYEKKALSHQVDFDGRVGLIPSFLLGGQIGHKLWSPISPNVMSDDLSTYFLATNLPTVVQEVLWKFIKSIKMSF